MRKIEKLSGDCMKYMWAEKINELVDAVNEIREGYMQKGTLGEMLWKTVIKAPIIKQTQEPERKETGESKIYINGEECEHKKIEDFPFAVCVRYKDEWLHFAVVENAPTSFMDSWLKEKPAKKECEHDFEEWILTQDGMYYRECSKCYKEEVKPKKDELAEKYRAMFLENRKDCGFGTFKIPDYKEMSKMMADEARKYFSNLVIGFGCGEYQNQSVDKLVDALLARLKGSK